MQHIFRNFVTSTFQRYKVCANQSSDERDMAPGSWGVGAFFRVFLAKIPAKRGKPPANRELHTIAGVSIFLTHPGSRINSWRAGKTQRAKAVVREEKHACAALFLKVLDLRETKRGLERYGPGNRGHRSVFGPSKGIFPIDIPARPGKILTIREFHALHRGELGFVRCGPANRGCWNVPHAKGSFSNRDSGLTGGALGDPRVAQGGQLYLAFGLVNASVKPWSNLVKLDQNWSNLSKLREMCSGPRLEVLSIWVMTPSSGNRSSLNKGKSKDHRHSIIKPAPVGHFSQGKNNGSSSGDVKPHQSHFDSHSGVVQSRSHDNLEEHLPTDQGEPASGISSVLQSYVARVAEPMVGVFYGSSSTKSGEDPSVANTTFNFGRISLVQIESFRRDSQAPNASRSTDYGREMRMGVMEHTTTLINENGATKRFLKEMGWSLMEQMRSLPQIDECPTSDMSLIMNIILWNCKGALKLNFRRSFSKLVNCHFITLKIVTETRVGGDRAKITDSLPFDGAIHADTIGYAGGIWLLWNTDVVDVSVLVATEQEIHAVIKVCSSNLSCFSSAPRSVWRVDNWTTCISVEESLMLSSPISTDEIKAALWSMKPFKAPSPDGLHAGFFQRSWHTFADCLSKFRPIGLCNTIYKVITKIIVLRLRPLLDKLISPLQTAFVPGRKGLDNMIIVQELVHSFSLKRGNSGFMAIKIDLEKAYDRLEWQFIRDMLIFFKIPEDLAKLIMSCITTSSISVLLNGGDLLWDPVKASRTGPSFSHLFFADDLVLFAKADQKNCQSVKEVLECFCDLSGQKISLHKSKAYFSPNVFSEQCNVLCFILGITSTPNLGKYLGFPIIHLGSLARDFDFVVEKIQSKLAGWKSNLLSMAGRVILAQSVTSSMPSYVMQGVLLPTKILKSIDQINRNFIWGSTDIRKKLHLVSWKKITKPKSASGLGLMAAKPKNLALAAKLCWRFKSNPHEPWVKVLRSKYMAGPRPRTYALSKTWTTMLKGEIICNLGSRWLIGSNCSLNFCFPGLAGSGGLIRNCVGDWISSFARNIGITGSAEAELWALRNGLTLCLQLRLPAVVVELDAQAIANILSSSNSYNGDLCPLVDDYREGPTRTLQDQGPPFFKPNPADLISDLERKRRRRSRAPMVEILSSNGEDREKARLAQNLASPNPLCRHSPHQASPSVAAASSRLSPGEEQSERVRKNERKREAQKKKKK
uniref:Reverse transcriptase domain-containing protein n=1 Tax=Fagus sylvatica TaxID=28930 RepID=A0A2N9J135_FAGSY